MTSAADKTGTKHRHAKILIVDDDAVVTESLTSLLKLETDYDIIPSYSPGEAVRILRDTPLDLIISDFLMPKMNGLQLLAEAKKLHPEVPRILLTGYADKENAIRAINEVGLFQFIEKPWDNEQLLLVIQNAIANRTLQEALTERIHELDEAERQRSRLKQRDQAMREELRQARQLQQSMFPDSFPT
ncbi:MAG: response regulator, partial [bacterium]